MKRLIVATLLAGVMLIYGCAGFGFGRKPSENEKQVNHQNVGAGTYLQEKAVSLNAALPDEVPATEEGRAALAETLTVTKNELTDLAQAGTDVHSNATVLQDGIVGKPEEPEPYSPKASALYRVEAKKDAVTPWWKSLAEGGTLLTAGAIALRLGGRFIPSLLGPAGGALAAVVEGIEIAKKGTHPSGHVGITDLLASLKRTQEKAGCRDHVTRVMRKVNGNA